MNKRGSGKVRESRGTVVSRWIIRAFLIIWCLLVAFPVIWVLYTSLKSN